MENMVIWMVGESGVLDAGVIARIFILCIVIELFGIASYWLRRF